MAVDPKHGRDMPSGRKIAAIIALALISLRKQSIDAARIGQSIPPYYAGLFLLFRQIAVEIEKYLLAGAKYSVANMPQVRDSRTSQLADSDSRNPKKVDFVGDIESQVPESGTSGAKVLQVKRWAKIESERQAMALVREIADTTRKEVQKAIDAGREAGEPLSRIQANVMGDTSANTIQDRVAELKVFDRKRAEVIGSDTAVRAMFTGQAEMGKQNGSIGLIWGISDGACEVCDKLDGQKRLHGEPFMEWPNAPPGYRFVYSAPAHPNCRCDCQDWWPD